MSWKLIDPPQDPDKIRKLSGSLNISPLLASLLVQRGYDSAQKITSFLNPALSLLSPLHEWPGVMAGARLLSESILKKHKIAVWGDYDVDGITATALIKDFFRRKGLHVNHYIPDRIEEGYGLNHQAVKNLAAEGIKTLVTVDCGISDFSEIRLAKELGMQVIITDHHLPDKTLPEADVLINPRCADCPCPELAGVGVAFLLMAALNREMDEPQLDIRDFLDLVALGSIADMVRLTGQNRVLVKNGLLLIKQPKRLGIQALKEVSRLGDKKNIGSGNVGFALGPRINAAGRLGNPETALHLLLAEDWSSAQKYASELNRMNGQRQQLESEILEEARDMARQKSDRTGLVLFSPAWHHGVIGIVASRIVDEFHRPCLIFAEKNGLLKGSGRSISDFDLFAGLQRIEHIFEGFGGHKMAAGMSLNKEKLEQLENEFDLLTREVLGDTPRPKKTTVDARVGFNQLTPELLDELEIMQPFGPGNASPVFVSPQLKVRNMKLFGQNKHISMDLLDEENKITLRGKIWRKGEELGKTDLSGRNVVVAYRPQKETYNGLTSINLNINEILEIK